MLPTTGSTRRSERGQRREDELGGTARMLADHEKALLLLLARVNELQKPRAKSWGAGGLLIWIPWGDQLPANSALSPPRSASGSADERELD